VDEEVDKPKRPEEINGDARIGYLENLFAFAQQEADTRALRVCGRLSRLESQMGTIIKMIITGLVGLVLALVGGIIGLVTLFLQL